MVRSVGLNLGIGGGGSCEVCRVKASQKASAGGNEQRTARKRCKSSLISSCLKKRVPNRSVRIELKGKIVSEPDFPQLT